MARAAVVALVLLVGFPSLGRADGGERAAPATWWRAWNADPHILLNLGLLAGLYGRGLTRLWRKAGVGMGVSRWHAAAFFASLAVVAVALLSPLDALSAELASAHMVQHLLLMLAAAPLFVLGMPALVVPWGLSRPWRRRLQAYAPPAGLFWQPLLVWALYAVTLWAWHHPLLYQAALRDPLVHDAQHLAFFGASCLFWRVVLDPLSRRRLAAPAAVPFLFTTALHAALLGIFLTLSPEPWYGAYIGRTSAWGLSPLEDQQLAGLIMWVPACLLYPAVTAVLFGSWLAGLSVSAPLREGG
jgi:putative membrane protein